MLIHLQKCYQAVLLVALLSKQPLTPTLQRIVEKKAYQCLDTLEHLLLAAELLRGVDTAIERLQELDSQHAERKKYKALKSEASRWFLSYTYPLLEKGGM